MNGLPKISRRGLLLGLSGAGVLCVCMFCTLVVLLARSDDSRQAREAPQENRRIPPIVSDQNGRPGRESGDEPGAASEQAAGAERPGLRPREDSSTGQTAAPRAGYVAGVATDRAGNPLPGVEISIWGTTLAGVETGFDTRTGEDGRYSQRVPDGIYGVDAIYSFDRDGVRYRFRLHPADGVPNNEKTYDSSEGVVRDFVWQLSGLTPFALDPSSKEPSDYYGGYITLNDEGWYLFDLGDYSTTPQQFPDGSIMVVTLTPEGPLLDGSVAQVLTFESEFPWDSPEDRLLLDIPPARYVATAELREPDGAVRPLRLAPLADTYETGQEIPEPADSAIVEFEPNNDSIYGGLFPVDLYAMY